MATQHETHNSSKTVSIGRTVSVRPKTKKTPELLQLSNLDRQCPALMYLVFFYKGCRQDFPLSSVFESLKSGLEETMSVWYPSAGRLRRDETDKLNIWCNNEGAIMVEASTMVRMEEIGELSEYKEFFEKLVYKPSLVINGDYSQMPLVVAQVTRFGCGGYSVGIGISHSLFDGPAAYDFLRAWSLNSAITKENRGLEVQIMPVLSRGPLKLPNFQVPNNGHVISCENKSPPPAIDHLYQLIMKVAMSPTSVPSTGYPKLVHKTFHLSGETIESWKMRFFNERKGSSFICSSFEVVATHLWKARTKALGIRKEASVCLQFPVDARSKMSPPLHKGFSGNGYVLVSVMMRAEELEKSSYEAIVEKVREAKNSVNTDYVISYMSALEASQDNTTIPPIKELTLVSDWTRMPFHNVGFLKEQADYVSPLVPPIPQVAYFMQNPRDKNGIDVRIGLFPHVIEAFVTNFFMTGKKP